MVSVNEARSYTFGAGPVVVTGSSGFLGKHVVAEYEKTGRPVIQYDIANGDDILDESGLRGALSRASLCVHLAAMADLYESDSRPGANFTLNVIGTETVARVCNDLSVPITYGSTCCAYGNNQPADVRSALSPTERYAASKAAGEFIVRQYSNSWRILRLPTMYGPGMRESLFVFRVIDAIANNEPVILHGSGDQARQYGYVKDIARAICRAPSGGGCIENLNGPEAISNIRVVGDVARLLGRGVSVSFAPERNGQIMSQSIRSSLSDVTPWCVGIANTVEWYREVYGLDRRSHNRSSQFLAAS